MNTRIQSAPGVRGCCDSAGRMIVIAYTPRTREQLIALSIAHGDGTRAQIEARIEDLLAAGLLIEIEG